MCEYCEKIHELKIMHEYFTEVKEGNKTFEIRRNDRNFHVGDIVKLNEINETGEYTGKYVYRIITYITDYAQKENYVVFGMATIDGIGSPDCVKRPLENMSDRVHELAEKIDIREFESKQEEEKMISKDEQERIDNDHNKVVRKNPDLHQGHAVPFDGKVENNNYYYPERTHPVSESLGYLPVDKLDDILMDPEKIKYDEY